MRNQLTDLHKQMSYLPVPYPLAPVTRAAEARGVTVDRMVAAEHAAAEVPAGTSDDDKARRAQINVAKKLLDLSRYGAVVRGGRYVLSNRTLRVHQTGPSVWQMANLLPAAFISRVGCTFVEVSARLSDLTALAALSGDPVLAVALDTDDVYSTLAGQLPAQLETHRLAVKYALWHSVFRSRPPVDDDNFSPAVRDALAQLMPDLYRYLNDARQLGGGLAHVHRTASEACIRMFVEVAERLAGVGEPVMVHADQITFEVTDTDRALDLLDGFRPTPVLGVALQPLAAYGRRLAQMHRARLT